jgi:hypothetical protein
VKLPSFVNFFLVTYFLYVQLQVLDSFFSTIPGFKSDIDPISARTHSVELASDSSAGPGAGSSRT